MNLRTFQILTTLFLLSGPLLAEKFDYRVVATTKTSTLEKEMNEAAQDGFVFGGVMGGESAVGGKEVVVVMVKNLDTPSPARIYTLLAANKTGTLQKELDEAGDAGFKYCGQTIFQSAFGGREVSIILERDPSQSRTRKVEYRLLATSKTSTMEKELQEAGNAGFEFLSIVIGKTAIGGKELVSLLQRIEK